MPRYCENCGREIPENSGFCPECGAQQALISTSHEFNFAQLIALAIAIAQIFLWNAKSIRVDMFFIKLDISLNELFAGSSSIGSYLDLDNLKMLNFVNILFYALIVLVIVCTLLKVIGVYHGKLMVSALELLLLVMLFVIFIAIICNLGDYKDYVSFTFTYLLSIITCLVQAVLAIYLK